MRTITGPRLAVGVIAAPAPKTCPDLDILYIIGGWGPFAALAHLGQKAAGLFGPNAADAGTPAPSTPAAGTVAGATWQPCGARSPRLAGKARRATCNRAAGHDGPHRQYLPSAAVVAEWTGDHR